MERTEDAEEDQEMITIALTIPYDHYLEFEDMAERNETTVQEELQEAVELAILTSRHIIDMRLDEATDWIDSVERSLLYNIGLNDQH